MRSYNTVALILGGGRGTRLYPLVKDRSKPAVSLGGHYRMIDIPVSNCINSGLRNIYVIIFTMPIDLITSLAVMLVYWQQSKLTLI